MLFPKIFKPFIRIRYFIRKFFESKILFSIVAMFEETVKDFKTPAHVIKSLISKIFVVSGISISELQTS